MDKPVVFLPAAVDACALYRQFIPHMNIPQSMYLFRLGHLNLKEFDHCSCAIVQRQVSEDNRNALRRIRQAGLKVIYDLDDNIWSLPASNPGKKEFDARRNGFEMCAKEADAFTVSTRGLASATKLEWSFLKKEISVVPNSIDFNLFSRKEIVRDDGLTVIGWGGSNTHSADLKDALSVIPDVLQKYPNSRIEFVGAPPENSLFQHPQCRFKLWVPVGEYANRLSSWAWDIAMAPLEDNRFNRSKSNIKMLEAAAIGVPCLVSNVQPYNEFCSLGGDDLKWLLCDTRKDWQTKLEVLLNEPERRKYLADKMYDVAYTYFNAAIVRDNWLHVINQALSC